MIHGSGCSGLNKGRHTGERQPKLNALGRCNLMPHGASDSLIVSLPAELWLMGGPATGYMIDPNIAQTLMWET